MKNYIVSDKQIDAIYKAGIDGEDLEYENVLQPIELVAEREMGINMIDAWVFDDKNINYITDSELWEDYKGKLVKIYIAKDIK